MKKAFLALAAVALLITSCGGNATGNGTDAQEDVKYQTYGGITSSSGAAGSSSTRAAAKAARTAFQVS